MEILNLHNLICNYYKQIFFLFVPNVCNSKCSFCYVEPRFSKYAVLSDSILSRTDEFVNVAKNIGFNEFRITGGEPLLFENISELFSIFKKNEVSYTLLTNGMNIQKHFELFESNRLKNITISYHSKIYHNNIFGVEYNTDLLDENIHKLCERRINLTVSILFLEKNKNEIISHVLHLKSLGVKSIKLIYPNNGKIKMSLKSEFIETAKCVNSITGMDVRYSELKTSMCSMVSRGFLSFHLSQNKIYGCCNSISNENFISSINSFDSLATTLWNFYNMAQELNEFPCESHVEFCPIALNN
jgi:molybdenum cofactor biosynthesis enzyme MoaA